MIRVGSPYNYIVLDDEMGRVWILSTIRHLCHLHGGKAPNILNDLALNHVPIAMHCNMRHVLTEVFVNFHTGCRNLTE